VDRSHIVIAGTDTGVGKTVFAAALAGALGADYWKPVQSGLQEATDSERVSALAGPGLGRIHPEAYRLALPASPHHAAAVEGVTIDALSLCPPHTEGRPLVIELAGGLLVPLTSTLLQLDVVRGWGHPVVLVARTALGTINHTLLAVEALRARQMEIIGVAFVGEEVSSSEDAIAALGSVKRLGRLPRIESLTPQAVRTSFAAHFELEDFR